MAKAESIKQEPWQKKAWVQWLAVAIGILPYILAAIFPVTQAGNYDALALMLSIAIWSSIIIIILLLLRFLCGERFRDLNLRAGTWWKDILMGIGLSLLTTLVIYFSSAQISPLFPGQTKPVVINLFNEVFQNPYLFALWIGPGLLSAAGLGEELLRTFVLTRLWKISSATAWKWTTVILYSVLFGLGHYYQGPRGIVIAGIASLMMSVYYLLCGRVTAMIVGHYLHDVIQFVFLYTLVNA